MQIGSVTISNDISLQGIDFQTVSIPVSGKWIQLSKDRKYYSETPGPNSGNSFLPPQNILAEALKNPASMRFQGETRVNEAMAFHIIAMAANNLTGLYIDKETNLLIQYSQLASHPTYGDTYNTVTYFAYKKYSGLPVPGRVSRSRKRSGPRRGARAAPPTGLPAPPSPPPTPRPPS